MPKQKSVFGESSAKLARLWSVASDGDHQRTPVNNETDTATDFVLQPGQEIGCFRVERELGRGASGIVYLAQDTRLDRPVAVKVLFSHRSLDPDIQSCFRREAMLLASLNHPNIAIIHEIVEGSEGSDCLILEYVPGETLTDRIARGPLELGEALNLSQQIIDGLTAAHQHNIVHRDLKPSNIRITPDGRVKILDFGIADIISLESSIVKDGPVPRKIIIGTPSYMSPEQAEGQPADYRTDIWAFGCILYEMVTGKRPFSGEDTSERIHSVLNLEPDLDLLPDHALEGFRRLVVKCLKKQPQDRYGSTVELANDLDRYLEEYSSRVVNVRAIPKLIRNPRFVFVSIAFLLIAASGSYWLYKTRERVHWARSIAIPEVIRLVTGKQYFGAFQLAKTVQQVIPEEKILVELWPKMCLPVSITTNPPGANIYFKEYSTPESKWTFLGRTPIENMYFPVGCCRWRIELDGYKILDVANLINPATKPLQFTLHKKGEVPEDMVTIPSGEFTMALTGFFAYHQVTLDSFLMDRYEVTNSQYLEFINQGGYANRQFWEYPLYRGDQEMSWNEAMAEFHDSTGLPGPSGWIQGRYPEGKGDNPVQGVSWYEAAAYAKFRGKTLPTIYHWTKAAAATTIQASIAPFSNFQNHQTVSVGSKPGIGFYGTYDLAGNVREWCLNLADEEKHTSYILGGSYEEPSYMYIVPVTLSTMDRSLMNGFRCIRELDNSTLRAEKRAFLKAPRTLMARDPRNAKPISDSDFEWLRKTHFAYDNQFPLDPEVQLISTTDIFRKERVTINAAYGGERLYVYLFLPNLTNVKPPYPAILDFPAGNGLVENSSKNISFNQYFVQKGCVWVSPVFKGMWERGPIAFDYTAADGLPICEWVKDWERTLDYLQTRSDIDSSRLVFLGGSLGGYMGCFISASPSQRFRASIMGPAGIPTWLRPLPQYDPVNFLPRIRIPVLLMTGRRDPVFPFETSQEPLYKLLGTSDEDKYWTVSPDGGHGGWFDDGIAWRSVLEFLHRYVGFPLDE